MEAEAKEPSGVTRGQNAVLVMPLDWSGAASALSTLVERIDVDRAETQLIIVTADAEQSAAAAHALIDIVGARAITVLAVTASPRASRLLKASPAHIVTGAPADLVVLLQASLLKAQSVRGLVFAWLDPILETPEAAPLETLLGEMPKDGARVVLASELTPAYEALIERYARRARREAVVAVDEGAPVLSAEYLAMSANSRGAALRRLLDALDLPKAELFARTESGRAEAAAVARSLGYSPEAVRTVSDGGAATPDPLVFLDLPATREELRALAGAGSRKLYALVQPSQIGSLRALLPGGSVTPIALVEAAERARGKDAALRASLREVLTTGDLRREVLALEPLLAEFDGIEIAAAALRMFEQQRPSRPAAAVAQAGPMQRLFVNIGEKDGARAQEVVSAITGEAGIPGSQVGRVEVRDTHSIVEVAASVAQLVVEKLSGAMVRGRKVLARMDVPKEDRPPRSAPSRGGPPRSGASRGPSDRPARSFDRGDRPARDDRGARPARSFDKADRPARPAAPRSGPARPFDRDGGSKRPTRPRPPRDNA